MMIQVFIIDDHKMVIEGMQLLLQHENDIKVIGTALSGEEGLEAVANTDVDVILLDINMPGINGIDTCKELLKIKPQLKIIAISMHKESSLIKLMLSSGAKGYVLKNAGQDEVIEAIKTVHDIVVNSVASNSNNKLNSPFPSLSRREKEVLKLILDEHTTQEIAEKLFISFGTVETHRRNMLIKTGVRNTAGLVRTALEYELYK